MDHFLDLLDRCGNVFLSNDGTIENHLGEFVMMVKETDKMLDLRCLYIQILKRTNKTILDRFCAPDIGGWPIISRWLKEAKRSDDVNSIIELLELLAKVPINISRLKTKNVDIPKWVKTLTKHENEKISKLALPLYECWLALVKEPTCNDKKKSPKKVMTPILITDEKRARNRKSISWQCDKDLTQVHYIELIEDERCNVTRPDYDAVNGTINSNNVNNNTNNLDVNPSARTMLSRDSCGTRSSSAFKRTLSNDGWPREPKHVDHMPWKLLIPIDFAFKILEPGWNSQERRVEADRELGVLRVLDLPGAQQTLSEPDIQDKVTLSTNTNLATHIPLEPIVPDANHCRDWSHTEWPRPHYGNNANSLLQQQHAQLQQQQLQVQQQQQQQQQLQIQQQQQLQIQQQQQLQIQQQQQQQQQFFFGQPQPFQHQPQQQAQIMFSNNQQSPQSSSLTAFLPPNKMARLCQPQIIPHQMANNNVRSMYEQPQQNGFRWVQTNRALMNMMTIQQHQPQPFQQRPQQ